jgi:hypothetical protein
MPTFSGMQVGHKVKAGCIHMTGGQNTSVWNIFFILKIENSMQQTFNAPSIKILQHSRLVLLLSLLISLLSTNKNCSVDTFLPRKIVYIWETLFWIFVY